MMKRLTLATIAIPLIFAAAGAAQQSASAQLTPEVLEGLALALQDEIDSEAVYGTVLEDFGEALPFAHTVKAEARHAEALRQIYRTRGLEIPTAKKMEIPRYKSLEAACIDAVELEKANVAIYDKALALDNLPADVEAVFQRNRDASLYRHLQAYERCVEGGGRYPGHGGRHGGGMGRGRWRDAGDAADDGVKASGPGGGNRRGDCPCDCRAKKTVS